MLTYIHGFGTALENYGYDLLTVDHVRALNGVRNASTSSGTWGQLRFLTFERRCRGMDYMPTLSRTATVTSWMGMKEVGTCRSRLVGGIDRAGSTGASPWQRNIS